MPRRLAALLAAALLLAGACGDSGDDGDASEREGGGDGGTRLEVTAFEFGFRPTEIEVEPGASVEIALVNSGTVAHTLTAEDADIDLEADAGGEATTAFTAPGEDASIEFVCSFHSDQMQGTIVVGAGGAEQPGGGSEDEGGDGSDDYDY